MTLAYYFRALTPVMFGARDGGRAGGGIALSMKVALVALSLVVLLGGLMIMPNMGGKVMNSAVACLLSPGVAK
jgi:hypothetical protein